MQKPTGSILPEEENNPVRPGDMPQPHLIEDVDENGNPVLKEGDIDMDELVAEDSDNQEPEDSRSSSGSEEKDFTD